MARAKNGEAISPGGRTAAAKKKLRRFTDAAKKRGDLEAGRRGAQCSGTSMDAESSSWRRSWT